MRPGSAGLPVVGGVLAVSVEQAIPDEIQCQGSPIVYGYLRTRTRDLETVAQLETELAELLHTHADRADEPQELPP